MNEPIEINPETTWEIPLKEKIQADYGKSYQISKWLQKNIQGLTDDNNKPLFNKVSLGFKEDNLKTFGVKPVCDVHINNTEYNQNFDYSLSDRVNSIILFYSKGTSDTSYLNACKIHDYILQEFTVNNDFKELPSVVRDTLIINSQLMIQPIRKKWGVMGAFELAHLLF